ncbi:MAG: hypothetical protein R3B06_06430 [Kofleriaceae bacterium]
MKKLLACLGLAMAISATGCTLYFGEQNDGPDCPAGTYAAYNEWGELVCAPGGGPGLYCSSDLQCASGCYCDEASGLCEEGGFCAVDADCGFGMSCDCSNSCVPAGTETRTCGSTCFDTGCPVGTTCAADGTCIPDVPGCTSDAECAAGCYCSGGQCEETSVCSTDADCPSNEHCDTTRSTCVPGAPAGPTCNGTLTCNLGAPTCPAGQVPLIQDGCYTGACTPLANCTGVPACGVLNTEQMCLDRVDCSPIYAGQNCTNPSGASCTMGSSNCTCETFSFDHCQ